MKDMLMQEYDNRRSSSRTGRRNLLVAALAVLLLGGAGFAAAGGVDLIKGWLLTVTVEVDGQVVAVEDVVLDEDGKGTFPIPAESMEGDVMTLSVEGGVLDGAPGGESGETAVVTMDVGVTQDGVAEIQVEVNEENDEDDEEE
jgi:hypothetical protein